ncbi:hypothetical protein FPQ18DRAFT_403311 [Pyronema domesticum]|nr:hypothetical protein FPQ18DRAFT_403311 [Pyronema domesticum]
MPDPTVFEDPQMRGIHHQWLMTQVDRAAEKAAPGAKRVQYETKRSRRMISAKIAKKIEAPYCAPEDIGVFIRSPSSRVPPLVVESIAGGYESLIEEAADTIEKLGERAAGEAEDIERPLTPPPTPRPRIQTPKTKEQFQTAMSNMITFLGLDAMIDEETMTAFAEKAAKNITATLSDLGLPETSTMALTKVNLFETIFYCDDSGSMAGSRYRMLKETISRLVPIATRLNERGVGLRFINSSTDSAHNHLTQQQVEQAIDNAPPSGGTPIGTVLERKIINPLIMEMANTPMRTPLLVSIITDGEPSGEDRSALKNAIIRCKNTLQNAGRLAAPGQAGNGAAGHSAVIFQIHYVGSDAADFIEELDRDIGHLIFCNLKKLDQVYSGDNHGERNQKLLEITEKAIDKAIEQARRK